MGPRKGFIRPQRCQLSLDAKVTWRRFMAKGVKGHIGARGGFRPVDRRNIAIGTKYQMDRQMLEDLAAELEVEAVLIEAEERAAKARPTPDDLQS